MKPRAIAAVNDITRDDARAALQAIKRELEDNRLTIVRTIINPDGTVVGEYRRTVRYPRHNERNTT